jgi:phosphohistidine phosphatase
MDLVLWRHAQAHDAVEGQADLERLLTRRGEKQAIKMAAWMDRHLPDGAKIWSSPARRTEQTVQALGRKYKLSSAIAPDASVDQLLELAQWPHAKGCAVLVGHQPTLGQTLSRLLGLSEAECSVKKGAVWWLRYREDEVQSKAVVVTVQCPDFM